MIVFEHPTRLIGSRGSRRPAMVRAMPASPEPSHTPEVAGPALPAPRVAAPTSRLARFARALLPFFPRRDDARERPRQPPGPPDHATERHDRSGDSALERGLRDIRRTDPGFDPTRFVGYAGMVFRDAHSAWMTRDFGVLRDRVTPEMHAALQAGCDRLRSTRRLNRMAEIDVTAVITDAWQEGGYDYVTAHIGGSMVDYTVDEASDSVVDGSRMVSRAVEQFWTFTRPAGLNFWMLSAIQTA